MTPHEHPDGVDEHDGEPGVLLDHPAEQHGYAEDADDLGTLLKMSRAKHREDHATTDGSGQAADPGGP